MASRRSLTRLSVARDRVAMSVAAAALLLVAGCGDIGIGDGGGDRVRGSGEVIAETRSVAGFEGIVLAGEGQVLFAAGSDGLIEIETDDNLHSLIQAEVSGGVLTISTEQGVDIDPTDDVTYRLGCPEISSVTLSGAGTIDLDGCGTTGRLELELAGAGTILAPSLDVSTVRVLLPGAGSIEAAGSADRLEVELAGAGEFDGVDLQATDGSVMSSGVGLTSVWATDNLDLRLTGVGSIRYYGEPSVTTTVTGVGTVEWLGPK